MIGFEHSTLRFVEWTFLVIILLHRLLKTCEPMNVL